MNRRIFGLAFLCWLLISCQQTNSSSTTEAKSTALTVSAAISLKDAMSDIKQIYSQSKLNVAITYNFDSSGILQQQIEQGAPVDIFISAAAKNMDALQQKQLLIDETRKNLLTNKIVLIVPKGNATISDFKNLTDRTVNKIAIGEPKSVPAGHYAGEVLTKTGIFDLVKSKIVFAKNVRQVLTYVETGNVDAGIVYLTDAKLSNKVRIAATADANLHSAIVYPIAVIKRTPNTAAAKEFVQFLNDAKAKTVFEKYGFIIVR